MWFCFGHSMCKWSIKTGPFSNSLKCENFRPVYEKVGTFDKKKYRPVSILPLLSKSLWKSDIGSSVKLFWTFFQWNFMWI